MSVDILESKRSRQVGDVTACSLPDPCAHAQSPIFAVMICVSCRTSDCEAPSSMIQLLAQWVKCLYKPGSCDTC